MILGVKQSEKTGRINLFVDGEFAFSVNARIYAQQYLRDGDEITADELEDLRVKDEFCGAYEKGLSLLEYGDNSRRELYRKLCMKYSPEASEAAVEKLEQLGFVDDCRYAKNLAESILRRKGYGRARIIQEICSKGISRDIAEQAVSELEGDDSDSLERAKEKLNIDFSDRKSVAKAYRKLYSMGFRGFSLGDLYSED